MDIELFGQIASIAQSVTVVTVLLAWLYREMKARDKLSDAILDDYSDLKSIRVRRLQNLPEKDTEPIS